MAAPAIMRTRRLAFRCTLEQHHGEDVQRQQQLDAQQDVIAQRVAAASHDVENPRNQQGGDRGVHHAA